MFARWRGLSSTSWSRHVAFHVAVIPRGRMQRRPDIGAFIRCASSVDGSRTSPTTIPRPKRGSASNSTGKRKTRNEKPESLFLLELMAIALLTIPITYLLENFFPGIDVVTRLIYGPPLNTRTFVPFTVVSKEQISATNFIITVRPQRAEKTRSARLEDYRRDTQCIPDTLFHSRFPFVHFYRSKLVLFRHSNVPVFQSAWEHGTWSVEIKEPYMQVAREYTPLPPPHDQEEDDLDFGHLRFLIRSVDGGGVSSYLSSVKVGDKIELRGPHLGYDVRTRTGVVEAPDGHDMWPTQARNVVFLAGGTGVAPALQVARAMLDGNALKPDDHYRQALEKELERPVHGKKFDAARKRAHNLAEAARASRQPSADAAKPHVTIVWANRQRADCVGCEALQADGLGRHESPIMQQLASLKRRHGDHFTVVCTVDEEGSYIDGSKILQAVDKGNAEAKAGWVGSTDDNENSSCVYHSQTATATTSGHDEAIPSPKKKGQLVSSHCVCSGGPRAAGKNLLMVSGPEGFVTTFAGSKVWDLGRQRQGPVGGVVGELMRKEPRLFANWLVLKL